MTELDRLQIVENMFPNWQEHLNDGKVLDQVLDGLSCKEIVLNKCSRPGCSHVARPGRKTCIECAAKAAQYMRKYHLRNASRKSGNDSSDQKACGATTRQTQDSPWTPL